MTVTFTLSQAAGLSFDPLPAYNITILRQSIFQLLTPPPVYLFVGQQQTFTMKPDESPALHSYVNVSVNCTSIDWDCSSFLSPSFMQFTTFDPSVDNSRSFVFTAPNSTTILSATAPLWTSVILTFSLSGPDQLHFINYAPVAIVIIPQGTLQLTVSQLTPESPLNNGDTFPLLMYSGEEPLTASVGLDYGTFSQVVFNVSWSFASNSTYLGVVQSQSPDSPYYSLFTFSTTSGLSAATYTDPTIYNPVYCTPALISNPSDPDCITATPTQQWTINVLHLTQPDVLTIVWTASGPDAAHYQLPQPMVINITHKLMCRQVEYPHQC